MVIGEQGKKTIPFLSLGCAAAQAGEDPDCSPRFRLVIHHGLANYSTLDESPVYGWLTDCFRIVNQIGVFRLGVRGLSASLCKVGLIKNYLNSNSGCTL